MKKLFVLFLVSGFSITILFGQSRSDAADVQWGNEIKAAKKSTLSNLIGSDKDGIYALFSASPHYYIAKYDLNLNQILVSPIEFDKIDKTEKGAEFEYITMFYDQIFLFYSIDDKKAKVNTLYVRSVDKSSLAINNDKQKVCEITFEKKRNDGSFNFLFSEDHTKMMMYYNLPYQKGEPEQFGYQVYNKGMELLWEKRITLPYKDELFHIEKNRVDNNGNAYLLGTLYKEKAISKRKGKPNYEYHILSYTNKGERENEYTVSLKDKFITDMQIGVTKTGDIICGGFYSSKGTYSIKGTFYLKVDANSKEIKNENYKEFEKDFLEQFMSEKKADKGNELYEYDLDKIVLREDGGAVLIAEQYFVQIVTTYSTVNGVTTSYTTYYYYYNDIIVININSDGSIAWAKKIPKKQVSTNDGGFYSSYAVSITKDKLYFIFNDNPKNLNNTTDKLNNYRPGNKESLTVLVSVDGNGEIEKEALFNVTEAETIIRPKVCEQTNPNEMIIYGQKGKMQRLAKITFK